MSVTVTPLADGGRVEATWAGGNSPVHLQKYDASGAKVGGEFVDDYSSNVQPQVVALSNGGYAVLVGFVFKGGEYPIRVFDAAGQQVGTAEAAGNGIGATLTASPSGGFMVVSMDQHYDNSGSAGGVDLSWRPFLTLYDNTGAVTKGPVGLSGDQPTVSVGADGHYLVHWVDGNIVHDLNIDPAHPPVLDKPATPTLTMIDDQGARTGPIAGTYTNDLTPVARVSVREVGWVEVSREGGFGDNERTMDGGIQVTAADVARGYIDVPMSAADFSGGAPYGFFARFKDADGVVSDAAVAKLNMFNATDIWSMTDNVGPVTGAIANGGTTDDATPTIRVGLESSGLAAGGAVNVYDGNTVVGQATLTAEDVSRGYVDITTSPLADGEHALRSWNNPIAPLKLTVSGGGATPAPEGKTYTSPGPNSTVAGGAGDDTLVASGGGDTLTGGAGADVFQFKTSPWSPVHVTDFVVGTDKLDFSAVLSAAGYTGSDPVADKVIWLQSDGAGGTQVLFDRDGAASGQQWPDYAIDLEHVSPTGLTWAKLTGVAAGPAPTSSTVNISPGAVSHAEGNSGVTAYSFTLTRSGDVSQVATTAYTVAGSGDHPVDASDISSGYGNFSFGWNAGETSKTITVNVVGDTTPETDESFSVVLRANGGGSNPTLVGANSSATGVVLNDDGSTNGVPGQVYNSPGPGSTVTGGAGNDTLNASQGADVLTGNGGADTFAYAHLPWTHGRITDFHLGEDRLDLSGMLRDAGYTGSDPVTDGYVRLTNDLSGTNTLVYFDADGNGTAHQWDGFFTTLEGVYGAGGTKGGVSTLTWAQVSGGSGGSSQPPPPPPQPSQDGQVVTSHQYGDTLTGTAGNDTLQAGQGPDRLTGAGGADLFAFQNPPWNAGHVTDFAPGVDKLDLRGLFGAYHGSNPLADGWLEFRPDGAGGTQVYVDHDGPNAGDWPFLITTLDGVAPGQLSAGDWIVS